VFTTLRDPKEVDRMLGRGHEAAQVGPSPRDLRQTVESLPRDHLKSDYAYYFVAPPSALNRPLVRAFRDWLFAVAEIEASPEASMALPAA